jgi:hypothetical protein
LNLIPRGQSMKNGNPCDSFFALEFFSKTRRMHCYEMNGFCRSGGRAARDTAPCPEENSNWLQDELPVVHKP